MARNPKYRQSNRNNEKRNNEIKETEVSVEETVYQDEIDELEAKAKEKLMFIVISIIVISCVIAIGVFGYKKYLEKNAEPKIVKEEVKVTDALKDLEKSLSIYNSNKRIISCMISNERTAWPQAGLQEAYMIYECLIEGGETRFMALFKENAPKKIGPIRSSRHYFVNFIREHNAIYAHFGWSPLAEKTIKQNGVNNINGIYDTYYYREGPGYNNAYSSISKVKEFAKQKGYKTESVNKSIYEYSIDNTYLETDSTKNANNISIKYSAMQNVAYKYNSAKKVYLRSMRGIPHIDKVTRKQLEVKNIVVLYQTYYNLNDYVGSARQQLDQVGTGEGVYITNGRYVPVTWSKSSDSAKTIIKDKEGKEIVLNDGLTFMQIVPKTYKIKVT